MTTLRTGPAGAPAPLVSPTALVELAGDLDELQAACGAPVTARRPWQQTWLDTFAGPGSGTTPLVVVVRGPGGRLEAAAPLAVQRARGVLRVLPIGAGPSDAVSLPARHPRAAAELAAGVATALADLGRPWLLVLRHLDPADAAVGALADALPHSALEPGDASPRLAFGPDRSLRAHVSRNHHQQVRRMRNRLVRDGREVRVEHVGTRAEVERAWPEVERVCRARDLQLRGASALDDPRHGAFLRAVVRLLADRGEVRLTLLHLDGRLAAYVLSFRDGPVRRMWNCRLDPALQDYGVGRLANDAALQDALDEPGCTTYDWMLGEESYKASMSDHVHRAVDLTAASGPLLWTGVRAAAAARLRLRAARDGGGRLGVLVERSEPTLRRLDPRGRA